MQYYAIIFVALLCGVLAYPRKDDGPQCQAPNGGGLTPVIKEIIDMLPLDEILAIYLDAVSNDPEVQAVMEFLESDEFFEIITAVTGTAEFTKIVITACDQLYLDVVYYLNVLNGILGLPVIPRPVQLKSAKPSRPGFHGLVLDLFNIIDVDALKELFIEKSKTDEYLKKALEIVKSQDFKNIIDSLHKTPAYSKMLNEFCALGVDVDAIFNSIRKYLGW